MQGFGIRTTTHKEKEYVVVYDSIKCDLCAKKCFDIIKAGREKGEIRIYGSYDYHDYGYGCFGSRKELNGNYEVYGCRGLICKVHINGCHVSKEDDYVRSIYVDKCEFHFYRETDDSANLKAVIEGYFREKDSKETLRAEQEKQAMREAAQSKRNAEISSAQRFLDEMYKVM